MKEEDMPDVEDLENLDAEGNDEAPKVAEGDAQEENPKQSANESSDQNHKTTEFGGTPACSEVITSQPKSSSPPKSPVQVREDSK